MAAITQNVDAAPFWPRPFWPPRNWWLALLAILVLAGALRFVGYDFSLPFLDQPDEAFFALAGQLIIDFGTAKSFGFRPLSTRYHQCLLHPIALLSRSGPAAGERRSGSSASSRPRRAWASSRCWDYSVTTRWAGRPVYSEQRSGPLFLCLWREAAGERRRSSSRFSRILALYLTFVGMRYRRESWTTHGTYALILAILFKYHALFLIPAVLYCALYGVGASRSVGSWKTPRG